jgi:hypothetical protein
MPIIPISGSAAPRGALVPITRYKVATTGIGDVTLSNIPQIYQDLYLVINATANAGYPYIFFNTYSSPAPSWTRTYATGSSVTSDRATQSTSGNVTNYSYQILSPIAPTIGEVHVFNYASTTAFKMPFMRGTSNQNGSGTTSLTFSSTGNTSPITSIVIATFFSGGSYSIGSTFTLYGVRSVNQ